MDPADQTPPQAGPVVRIDSLDVLRGFALLGILVMNIQSFAMIEAAYFNPTAYGSLEGVHWWVWYLGRMLVDTKFMAIFSMLFGASTLLMIQSSQARGARPFAVHARRNLVLLLVGFLHGQFLWHGDVLYHYALSAFFIYVFHRRSPRTLFIAGGLVLAIGSGLWLAAGLSADQWPEVALKQNAADWQPGPEAVQEELDSYRGGWAEQNHHRRESATQMQTMVFLFYFLWRSSGMMLMGMGLFKLGVLSAARSARFYWISVLVAVVVGLPLVHLSVSTSQASNWHPIDSFFLTTQYNYWGSVAVALGWVSVVMLLCQSAVWLRRLAPLAAVGRMAFTNYLMQTVICTFVFYGHGLGLFGSVERLGQFAIVVGVWILQLIYSTLWMRHFRYGPAEWLWRCATYLRWQPLRR